MVSRRDLVSCPECGTEFPAGRLACPECGSDAQTGWKDEEEIQYQSVELPEKEGSEHVRLRGPRVRYLTLALILAILGVLVFILVR
jgi:hypothetical protein